MPGVVCTRAAAIDRFDTMWFIYEDGLMIEAKWDESLNKLKFKGNTKSEGLPDGYVISDKDLLQRIVAISNAIATKMKSPIEFDDLLANVGLMPPEVKG